MLRRDDRQERRDDPGPGPAGGGGPAHYQMRQKMVAIGDDFWIENDRGEKVYKVDGKALRVRQTLILEDRNGHELCQDPGAHAARQGQHGDRRRQRQAGWPWSRRR